MTHTDVVSHRPRLALSLLLACALLALTATAAHAAVTARGSVEQVQVTGAKHGGKLSLINRNGKALQTAKADSLGGLVFRDVKPGAGYRVLQGSAATRALTVLSDKSAPPNTAIYNQAIPTSGYGYLTTRDGTQLAINVQLPGGAGPYPTLVEYSGYGYANPAGGESSIAQIATLLGFAVVDVNMRGTGCSGGAFDYFEPLQGLDGYDIVETVARQPWVLHHKVGMMGVSYGGISQLFVAETNPPSLAGITPLSVIDNTATTLYPGGILNTGFALSWAKDRVHDAKPASPTGGQKWALTRIRQGDKTCQANQALHGDAVDLLSKIHDNRYYVPKVADPLAPITFVHKIKVPVYMACQWTDEQTGGHCADLASNFTGTQRKWFTFTNGTHIDSLDPATFNRWYDFLELYVAQQKPELSPGLKALAPTVFSTAMGVPNVNLPDDPIQSQPDYASALAAFQALPQVRILFDNGAGSSPGSPVAGLRAVLRELPAARHAGSLLVPDGRRRPGRQGARQGRQRHLQLEQVGAAGDQLQRQHRLGHQRALDRHPALPLAAGPGGHPARLPQRAADRQHRDRRPRRPRCLDQVLGARRGPAGHDLRGPARRQGDVRAGRLAARQPPQARPQEEHAARACAEPHQGGRRSASQGSLHRGDGAALLRGPRLPGRVADPGDDRGAGRRPAGVVVRQHHAEGPRHRDAGLLAQDALAADPAAGARRGRAHPAAALPGAARRALPHVPAAGQPRHVSRIARYGKAVAREGHGQELADLLLAAAAELTGDPGCELYLVNRQTGQPDTIWVTELWRDQQALDASLEKIRGSDSVSAAMALVESWEMIELDLLGGKGPR